jgi:drug/metabolite transporter (DMT)-like permease
MTIEVVLGVVAAGAAAVCFDGAVVLQARAAREIDVVDAVRLGLIKRLMARRRWLAGTGIAMVGLPLALAALALAPLTVVQPTLALGMLVLLAAGARVLDEHVGRREWLAAGAVIGGVALLALAGPRHSDAVPKLAHAAWPSVALALVAVSPFVVRRGSSLAWLLIVAAGSAFALSAICAKILVGQLAAGHPWRAVAFAAVAGVCSGLGLLIEMTALQRFEATRVAPPMFVLETAVPVALAPWLFGEAWPGAPLADAALAVGLALVLCGGGLLGASRPVASLERGAGGEGEDALGGARPAAVGEVGALR